VLERASEVLQNLSREIDHPNITGPSPAAPSALPTSSDRPIPVEVRQPDPGALQTLAALIAPLIHPLATTGIVVIFIIFILIQKQDLTHCRSPSCVPAVASAPPRSISGSPCSLTPAASSKPTTDIASPTADPGTSDNHNKAANAPTSQFPFPGSLQVRERESGSACGRRLSRATGRSQSNTFSGSAPRSILPSRPLDLDAVARSGSQDRPASGPPKAWS
jgi:hypothetical protein